MKSKDNYDKLFAFSQNALGTFTVQIERERDGQWTGSIEVPEVGVCADSAEDAHKAAHVQAFRALADELESQLKDPVDGTPFSHLGVHNYRCANSASERAFAEAWSKRNGGLAGSSAVRYLAHMLDDETSGIRIYEESQVLSQRDCTVAATVIQWLGSNGGVDFLTEALETAGSSYVNKLKIHHQPIQVDLEVFTATLAQKLGVYTKTILRLMSITASESSEETVKSLVHDIIAEQDDPGKAQELLIPIQEAFLKEWNEQ